MPIERTIPPTDQPKPPSVTTPYARKLTDEQKTYVVTRLATYHSPTAIARDLKELFGVTITVQSVDYYHPQRATSGMLAQRWKDLFWETRKAYLAGCAQAGTVEQMVRIQLREDMVLMARDAGQYRVANELLNCIAKEAGRMFDAGYARKQSTAPEPWTRGTMIYESTDGTREIFPGDSSTAPTVVIRGLPAKEAE
jgi:hypothetical protein